MSHKNHQRSQNNFGRPARRTRNEGRHEDGKLLMEFLNMQAELEKMLADKDNTEKR